MIHDDVALGARYNYAPVITNSNLQFWRFTVGAGNPSVNTAYYVPVVEVRIIACIILHRFECWRWWPKMIDLHLPSYFIQHPVVCYALARTIGWW